MPKTVGVAVSNATFHFDKLYTYAVMPDQQEAVRLGSMVLVPFGRGSKARMGVVLACDEEPEHAKLKYLFDVAPASACLTPELLRLVHFLKERTFCTYYEAVKAVIPYGAQYKPALAADGVTPVLQKQLTRHTENSYKLVGALQQKPRPTAKQLAAVALLSGGERTQNEMEAHGITKAVLDNLCAKGVVECSKVNKSIDLYSSIPLKNEPITLTAEQQAAYDALLPGLEDTAPHSALLYGVTGSGKTLVFLKLIERCLALGRRALVLVPEISLTPQMILRLKSRFGRRVAVQHSALNHTERLLQWQMIQDGGADIVVGTRSAVFAPLENIGLVIIDEEQEHTYRSESAPRYAAHEVARQRAAAPCSFWPALPPAPRAFTPPRMAAPSSSGSPSATAATHCPASRSSICGQSWPRATRGRSALRWRTPSGATSMRASRPSCCSTAAATRPWPSATTAARC